MASDELGCHFTWNLDKKLEGEIYSDGWINKIPYLLKKITLAPEFKTTYLIHLGYFYAQEENDLDKALECLNDAIDSCDKISGAHPQFEGYKIVALRNKIKILNLKGKTFLETSKLHKELKMLQPISSSTRAGIYGLKGYTMGLFFATKRLEEGIRCFQKAIELDNENYIWYIGKGKLLQTLRRHTENHDIPNPHGEEESMFMKAVELTERKNAVALILLADYYIEKVKRNPKMVRDCKEAEELYMEAYILSPNDVFILKQCGDSFLRMRKTDLAEECLLKAEKLDPLDIRVKYRLAKLYDYGKGDLKKAEKYLVECVSGEYKDIFADIHLAKLRKRRNKNYDSLKHLRGCRKYVKWTRGKEVLEEEIKKLENEQIRKRTRELTRQILHY